MTLAVVYKLLAIFATVALGWVAGRWGWIGGRGGAGGDRADPLALTRAARA